MIDSYLGLHPNKGLTETTELAHRQSHQHVVALGRKPRLSTGIKTVDSGIGIPRKENKPTTGE
jgi:hypothetical protein